MVELLEIVASSKSDDTLRDAFETIWHDITDAECPASLDKERIFHHVMTAESTSVEQAPVGEVRRLNRPKEKWLRAAAAAVLAISLGGSAYYYFRTTPAAPVKSLSLAHSRFKNDVLPGGNRAVLTLANGSSIVLDSARNGTLARQGSTMVVKLDNGQLAYKGEGHDNRQAADIGYNTVTTPRGGQYRVVLPDGSKVWLNAASSLSFPTTFSGKERKVILTGEAYFEIQRDKDKPFSVTVNKMTVDVLGTRFNIMAYGDEATVKTTLLDGAVKVLSSGKAAVTLAHGEQAELGQDGEIKVRPNADMDETMAWKDGWFYFHNTDIKTVMRQLARWYNIQIVYSKNIEQGFYAKIPRNTNLSTVLKALTLTGSLHIDIEGSQVTVQP